MYADMVCISACRNQIYNSIRMSCFFVHVFVLAMFCLYHVPLAVVTVMGKRFVEGGNYCETSTKLMTKQNEDHAEETQNLKNKHKISVHVQDDTCSAALCGKFIPRLAANGLQFICNVGTITKWCPGMFCVQGHT